MPPNRKAKLPSPWDRFLGSGVICCAMAILAMPEHGRDARGTSK